MEENKEFQNGSVAAADVNIRKAEAFRQAEIGTEKSSMLYKLKRLAALAAVAAIFGIVAAAVFQGVIWLNTREAGSKAATDQLNSSYPLTENKQGIPVNSLGELPFEPVTVTDVSGVVENVMPAIVAINCRTETIAAEYDFFGRRHENKKQGASTGTGIIIGQSDEEVLIVTNHHVIENAVRVNAAFCDGVLLQATIKGTELGNDLAVIAVSLSELPETTLEAIRIATLGDSDSAKMGEMVIAIGNAIGYGQCVTVGYISALNRRVEVENVELELIQVDAAINPGNSGGALLNANGEVIGINSVKHSSADVEGIGYAIPISEVIPLINEMMNREKLEESEQAYLPIEGIDIDASYSASFRLPAGIYISNIAENSPAAQAGLRPGDILVGINGRAVSTMEELEKVLSYTRGGIEATLQIKVLEGGSYVDKELRVVLEYQGQR